MRTDRGTGAVMLALAQHVRAGRTGRRGHATLSSTDRSPSPRASATGICWPGHSTSKASVTCSSATRSRPGCSWPRAVELARPLGDLVLLATVVANYSQVLEGDDEAADDVLAESMAIALRLGRTFTIALAIGNRMRSLILRGDWDGVEAIGATARDLELGTFSGEPQRWSRTRRVPR